MKIRTVPPNRLALLCTAVVAAMLIFSDRASAVSIRDGHELGLVQFGAPSRHSDGSAYINNLIGMAFRSDERANGYFRSDASTRHAVATDHMNTGNAGGRSVEVITIPSPGGIPGSGTGVPDGGTTAMLLGAALSVLGIARRYIRN
jgi:hypothetical protein